MKKIVLVGQPNVGKSTIFNAITRAKAIVSNYPGTTVDVTKGSLKIGEEMYEIIDTPGIYSLLSSSEEERVTEKILLEDKPDTVIQIIDSTSLERNLNLTLQLIEMKLPMIIVFNFLNDAKKKGIEIQEKSLSKTFGIRVLKINPFDKKDIQHLLASLKKADVGHFDLRYDDHIEKAISTVEERIKVKNDISRRFIAIRLLEKDSLVWGNFGKDVDISDLKKKIPEHSNMAQDIMITRFGTASLIARTCTKIHRLGRERLPKLDRFIIYNRIGSTIFVLAVFGLIFTSLFFLGGFFQSLISTAFENILTHNILAMLPAHTLLGDVVNYSFVGLEAGLAIAIPYVGIFYFILAILEDSGVLPRFILTLNGLFEHIGLPGKSIIPIMLGLGCSVPAIRGTRILPSKTDRLKTSILFLSVPCSSRTAIIMGVVGHFAGFFYAISIYLIAFLVFIFTAFILKYTVKRAPMPFIEELPPYRIPRPENVIIKGWLRMKDFIYIVLPLLIVGGAFYAMLLHIGIVKDIVKPMRFLTVRWLHLPENTIVPLIYGFLQKDLVPAMLFVTLGTSNIATVMSRSQIFTFGLATTFQIPCIIAFSMLVKEFGWKTATLIEIGAFAYGMFLSGLILRISILFS
jgi:ferrous iron transport protein B